MSILPHQQRVIEEKAELDARLGNLIPFLSARGLSRGEWKTLQL